MTLFLDAALPVSSGVGLAAIGVVLLIGGVIAFIAFRMLRKSVKMAFRMTIVALILLIAVAGSISLWMVGSSKPARTDRPRSTQSK